MNFSMRLSPSLKLKQKIGLTLKQRFTMRLKMVLAITDRQLNPLAVCCSCGHSLSLEEILKGFLPDPVNTTTQCPVCKYRFQPKLNCRDPYGAYSVSFYCASQTLHRLNPQRFYTPEEFQKTQPSLYHSALAHFGSLHGAFKQLGHNYPHDKQKKWREKARPFLGRYPDSLIAECVGVTTSAVGQYRRSRGIPSWSKNKK